MIEDSPVALEPSQDTASLVKRLAGPSVTKAGLAKDQTEINRIIAEVSKGSKFYENEKRKDKELTERIAKILKIKDDVVKSANIQELEAERDLSQAIVHVDMDAFYASVELLLNPDLEGKPFGVCLGVLSTASYEARKHGVRSGMAGFVAKKLCPELIVIPVNFEKYSEMSRKVMSIFKEYDPTMIVAGCDEGYLNITKYCAQHGISPEDCVKEMRQKVHEETKLTASAGIASNKICSDKNKPNGQFALPSERDAITAFMRDLSIRKLPGVGRVHERLLDSIGVKTCGDIYAHRAVIWLMDHYFSKIFLYSAYLGIASNVVEPYQRDERKSIGAERTFTPISDHEKLLEKLEEVAEELENDMRDNGWAGKTVTLKYKLNTYQVYTRAKSFNRWITRKEDLFNTGKELLKPELPLCLRLIGLRVTKLKDLRARADQGIKRRRKLDSSADDQLHEFQRLVDEEEADAIKMSEFPDELDNALEADIHNESLKKPASSTSRDTYVDAGEDQRHNANLDPSTPERDLDENNTQQCPICAKLLDTRDNAALNAHIDFCLSKDIIKQASASASHGKSPAISNGARKPRSKVGPRKGNRTLDNWDWKGR
ncbi:DNA/RNA polymerase [Fomitiporia mediterranea MF3/22]|uniref:DNA/RNA polymerase n=1 Tax=Fomitiporia mediterranea (strain MF3/22) TaxID=694068 RepID=UPI0004408980|nr:DNA/RNA polymerase [Fomitiporia mediterranea MF3/22]EJD03310.1 DNA/RNA polymerase [Fomitiporia mediterranea MF3/22]